MVDRNAVVAWQRRQRQLLHDTYDQAWQDGVGGYQPLPAADNPPDHQGRDLAAAGALGALGGLLARRRAPYQPPATPDPLLRARATAPAEKGLQRMVGELINLTPSEADTAAARSAVDSGLISTDQALQYAIGQALGRWIDSNAYRLNPGESVAWAGEQDGYAAAADADGVLLEWIAEDDDSTCDDCRDLADLPPMPASDWPTTPGAGDTECNVGCRCTLAATDQLGPGDQLYPLTDHDTQVIDRIASDRAAALAT